MSPLTSSPATFDAFASAMNVPTNPAAPVQARQRIRIHARPEKVWAVLTNSNA